MMIDRMRLELTSFASPEQYDVFDGDRKVACFRLRHGWFTAQCPDVEGETVYSASTKGNGLFYGEEERQYHLTAAVGAVMAKLYPTVPSPAQLIL
jgi:hypothetical protein